MTESATTPAPPPFEAPGPGTWDNDSSHCPPAPTLLFRRVASTTMPAAYRHVFEQFGSPLATMDVRFVNGKMFRRLVPLVGADKTGPPPPKPVLWLATRVHPAFRRRERSARSVIADRPYLDVVAGWAATERDEWIAGNVALQSIDPAGLDDESLATHIEAVDARLVAGWTRHHILHGSDVGPIGDLLAHTNSWGLDQVEVMALLRGASPATLEGAEHGRRIATALRDAGIDPAGITSLDAVRDVPAAAAALDAYLDLYGWRVVTSYDLEGLTCGELPGATCALIRSAAQRSDDDADDGATATATATARVREQVPQALRAGFDELLDGARRAYGMRDDNGPLTAEWTMGLVRRAYLEAGRRLAANGRLDAARHVFELDTPEVAAALRGLPAPDSADVAARASYRAAEAQLTPPAVLGPPMPPPDTSVFPPGMRRVMDIVLAAVAILEVDPAREVPVLNGLGIGTSVHRGVARVGTDPDRVLEAMEPGDVLVAAWTAPTYNAVFSIAGAVVVQEGGLLCHAAVMARELGIPSVIGCRDAMTAIGDGDVVDVDPVAGEVRIVERAG